MRNNLRMYILVVILVVPYQQYNFVFNQPFINVEVNKTVNNY